MERLTYEIMHSGWCVDKGKIREDDISGAGHIAVCGEAIDRLAEYEDTGLTPEQIKQQFGFTAEVIAQRWGVAADRLRELAQADKDGRCVILPCKVGDDVFYVYYDFTYSKKLICRVLFTVKLLPEIGKTVFLTREEAEAALKGAK